MSYEWDNVEQKSELFGPSNDESSYFYKRGKKNCLRVRR